MTFRIYRRLGEFPRCKHCGRLMDYWNPYQDENTYEHIECAAEEFGKEVAKILRGHFEKTKDDEKGI